MDRADLIVRHMDWARKEALRYRGHGVSDDDLAGQAYLGLCDAGEDYDPETHPGVSFAAYARTLIRKRVMESIEQAPIFRMPRRLERAAVKVRQALAALMAAGEPRPTLDAIAQATGLDAELCREAMSISPSPTSVESFGVMPDLPDPDQQRLLELVEDVLDRCTELGRTVLLMCRTEDLSLGQVARRLGRPLREVRRAHDDACLTVSTEMRSRGWSETTWAAAIA